MLIEWLARLWAVNDPLPQTCDLLVPIAHGATSHNRLTYGAYAVARKTAEILHLLREIGQLPFVAFGAFTGSKNPEIEASIKATFFHGKYVGHVVSTIEECRKVKENLPEKFTPRSIVVVSDEAHSRRCRIVWKTFFPNSQISIVSVKISETVDKESPMLPYRLGSWAVLAFQALPTPYFWYLAIRGPKYMAKMATNIHQPIAK